MYFLRKSCQMMIICIAVKVQTMGGVYRRCGRDTAAAQPQHRLKQAIRLKKEDWLLRWPSECWTGRQGEEEGEYRQKEEEEEVCKDKGCLTSWVAEWQCVCRCCPRLDLCVCHAQSISILRKSVAANRKTANRVASCKLHFSLQLLSLLRKCTSVCLCLPVCVCVCDFFLPYLFAVFAWSHFGRRCRSIGRWVVINAAAKDINLAA